MQKTEEQIRLAYSVLDYIEAHPEKHDQTMWVSRTFGVVTPEAALADCGTTACVAGWTVLLSGLSITGYELVVGTGRHVPELAAGLLGLDGLDPDEEGHRLFYMADDLADVRKEINDIFGPRPDGAM